MDKTQKAFASRLKKARENARYTRPALAEATGIPLKSFEKFELGGMEPNISRLLNISEVLEVSIDYLINGDNKSSIEHEDVEVVHANIQQIAQYREEGFAQHVRKTKSLIDDLKSNLGKLEKDDLFKVAEKCDVFELPDIEKIEELLGEDMTLEDYLNEIEERIIDIAVIGVDLYSFEISDLDSIAYYDHDITGDKTSMAIFSEWSGHYALMQIMRPIWRKEALTDCLPVILHSETHTEEDIEDA